MVDKNRLIPAASYIRMSSTGQECSPSQQRAEVAKLAAKHGCYIATEFFDDAVSGDDMPRRKGFQAMHKAACNGGGFKIIFCWDQDRFGRFDPIEAGYWIWPLRTAGVKLITVAQGVISWDDFQGRMIYMIQQEGKHQFLRDLSRNVCRGQLAGAARRATARWAMPLRLQPHQSAVGTQSEDGTRGTSHLQGTGRRIFDQRDSRSVEL